MVAERVDEVPGGKGPRKHHTVLTGVRKAILKRARENPHEYAPPTKKRTYGHHNRQLHPPRLPGRFSFEYFSEDD